MVLGEETLFYYRHIFKTNSECGVINKEDMYSLVFCC